MLEQLSSRARPVSRRAALGMIGVAALARSGQPGFAQGPEPIRIVIAFPPGGTSTASLQPLRAPLGASLGAPIELEYHPGLGGNVAALRVIQAKPDGRTLLFGHAGPLAINHHLLVQTPSAISPRSRWWRRIPSSSVRRPGSMYRRSRNLSNSLAARS